MVGGFDVDGGAELTLVDVNIDIQEGDMGLGGVSLNYSTADEEHSVFVRKLHLYFFVSSLRLTTLTCGPDDANRLS